MRACAVLDATRMRQHGAVARLPTLPYTPPFSAVCSCLTLNCCAVSLLAQVNVRVTTMDAELEFAIQPSTTGKQLFDQVRAARVCVHSE